ncbi:MAG: glycosyltransferase family 4 protein [Proteobacteria bacterium]|nr:glycosyltransferase family 4 protein [Pseudomonadota bacterium]
MTIVSCETFSSLKCKPTILQVIPALSSGGVEIETIEIAKAIIAGGGRAVIVSGTGGDGIKEEGIEFRTLPLNTKNPFRIAKNATHLKNLILKEKVDLVHARSRAPAWSASRAARAAKVPFVTTYHAAYSSGSILKVFYNSIMARGDRVIAISRFIESHVIEKYKKFSWFEVSKIRRIDRGIDLHLFDPAAISKERVENLKDEWGMSSGKRLILLPGRITQKKGQELVINALSRMKQKDVVLVLAGSAQEHESYRDFLLQYAKSIGLEDRVKWVYPCSDLPAAYQLADVIVCPSLAPEGFGRVIAEAQAMKKPIIVSNHGAAIEVIEDGVTGWAIPPGDVDALARALDDVLALSPARLKDIGEKGRRRVEIYYSRDMMGSKTIAVYKELLEGREKR